MAGLSSSSICQPVSLSKVRFFPEAGGSGKGGTNGGRGGSGPSASLLFVVGRLGGSGVVGRLGGSGVGA
eukprot:617321-Prymnesium_polylepis.2